MPKMSNVLIFSHVAASFLPGSHVVYVYCSEVMRWLRYGSKTGRYIDTCGIK